MGNKDSRQLFQSILRAFARFAIIFVVLFASVYYHGSTKVYALSDCPGGAGDITISANTSWAQGDYSCSSLTVNSGATLTIAGNTTIALTAAAGNGIYVTGNSTLITSGDITAGTGVTFTVASDVTIDTGSKISADAKGYGGTGPGSGPNGSWTGGGYGGMSTSGVTYGSAIAPVSLGSGAYNSVGGGAVKINIAGNLVNSGTITANGGVTSTNGGSGGSVWINFTGGASTWTGTSGIVTASGISYGAGGRVAVTEYVSDTRTGGSVLATGSNSSAGTVYTKSTAQSNGVLTIDNNTAISTTGKYAQTDIASLTLDSLIVKNKGAFNLPSGSTITIAASGSIGGTSDAAVNIASGGIIDASGAATLAGPAVTNNLGATFTTAATWTLALPLIQRGTLTQNTALTVASGGTLTADVAGDTFASILVQSGGNITHTADPFVETYKVDLVVTGNVTVDSGGTINVNGLGFDSVSGPGSGGNVVNGAGGYGGMGTNGVTYGSATAPVNIGSGAYSQFGGGAIKLSIGGNLSNSGTISSNGSQRLNLDGGGSGGSVWINFTGGASTWTGTSGVITANGGIPGAGGRVAITEYVSDTRTGGSVLAIGNWKSSAGTVYTKSTAQTNGTLTIDNNSVNASATKYAQTNAASLTLDSLIVKNKGAINLPTGTTITIAASGSISGTSDAAINIASGGILDSSGTATLSGPIVTNNLGGTLTTAATWSLATSLIQRGTLTQNTALTVASGGTLTADVAGDTFASILVQSGGNITHTADPFVETYKVDLVVTGNVTVDSGGTINVNGLGFDSVSGPGSGGNVVNGAGGYGGMGTNGVTYGSATAPVNIGSGAYSQFGGGAIKLSIGGNLSNSGTISSNGSQRLNLDGGGSGGSVWINFTGGASTWTGTSGVITANGGIPGAGGRVAITEYVSDTRTGGSVLAIGNWKSSAGTVYTKSTAQTNGTLTIDNNSVNASATKYAQTNAASLTLDSLIVKNKGAINLPTGTTITIAASGSISGTSDAAINIASGGILDSSGTATLSGPIVTNNLGGTLTTAATWSLATSLIQRGTLTQNTALTVASGGTLTADVAGDTFASILVQSGGNITHTANTNAETYKINLTITGNLTVNSGGTINTLEKGFGAGFGSGTGDRAGYGGEANSSTGGGTYGSTTAPESLGSGSTTRSGGGAIKINVGGDFSNSGVISSDGYSAVGGNSASGGSVWINLTGVASAWAGTSGQINAKGGWGAGGGRIAITGYVTDTHTGTQDAATTTAGGASGTIFTKSTSQTNGTLTIDAKAAVIVAGKYTKTNAASLTLDALSVINKAMFQIPSGTSITINSGGTITGNTNSYIYNADTLNVGAAVGAAGGGPVITNTGTIATPATWSLGTQIIQRGTITQSTALTIISGGILTADISGDTFSSVTIQSGGKINHSANVASETYKNVLNIGSLTINSGGSIDVAGLGYTGGSAGVKGNGTGFGGLGGSNSSGGGAGYGGVGGAGLGGSPGSAGTTYGSSTVPLNIGSGGGGGVSAAGGAGGGSVILNITSNFINAGTITANGAAGSSGNYGGGGGSGGTVSLNIGGNFDCTGGAVTANGGAGAGSPTKGGGGGGGRLLRSVSGTYTACTTFTVSGGTGGGNSGSDGTSSVPPAAPIISAASAISATSITWNWVDNSTTETQFIVHDGSESVITTVNSSTTAGTGTAYSYIESSLTPNTSYTRHVHATDGTFNSSASSTASAYTLANAPTAPTLSAQTTTGMVATIAVNSNPVGTQYVIHETSTNKYVQADGTLGVSAVWQTYNNWGGASGQVTSGLLVNTNYVYEVKARNADSVETAYSLTANSYTLANAPGAPTLSTATETTLKLVLDQNSNPSITTYAIYDITDSKYVQADGTLGASAVWQTYTQWGGASGQTISGLTPNTSHTLKAKARNGDNTETAFSPDSAALVTLANAPGKPALSAATETGLTVTLNENSNPSIVTYAIYDITDSKYVQADGTLGASAVWQTYTQWGGASGKAVTGLSVNTSHSLKAKARNSENVETAFSADSDTVYTLASTSISVAISAPSATTLNATISNGSNPPSTTFAIHEIGTNKFIQIDGTLGVSAVWQTYNNWGGASGQVTSGLLVNTNYVYEVKARNADSVETAYSATAALYTLANVPGKPTLANPAGNSISITINENSNPATTTYAIYDNTDSKYVQADGTLGDGDVWQTYTNWGGVSGKSVLGLTPNTSYTMKVKARNGNNTETAFSADSDALATLVSASDAPTISNPTSSSILITINTNSNPVSAQYAIHETSTNKFVQADGTLGASAVWQTYAQWGGASGQTVSGLSINTNYTLEVKARNAENVETAYSATTTKATLSVVPTITSGEAVSTTSVKITFGTDTNPDDTSYAVYESSTNKYLQADGTLGDSISWLVKTIINSASGNIVTGLASGSTFVFSSKTKNKDGVETDYSSTVSVNTDSAITDSAIKPLPTGPMPPAVITAPSTTSTTSTTSYSPTPTPTDTTTSSSETPTPTDTSTSTSISPYPTVITTSSDGVEPCTDPGLLEQLFSNGNSYHCENGNRIDDTPPPPPPCYIFCGVDLRVHFLLPGGTYDEPTNVTIFYTPKSHAAQIRYTLDGSEPNNYSPLYTEPVYVPASVTIKAKAYGSESPTEIADFVIKQPAAGINTNENGDTPQLSITSDPAKPQLSNNLYLSPLPINITAPENTRVYYTLTGGKPVVESTSYSGSFNITKSAIVTAIAVDGDKIVATGQRQFSLATEPATVSQTTLDKIANPVGSSTLVTAGLVVSFWAGILQLILAWFQYFLRLLLLLPALLFGRKKKPNLVGKTVRGGMGEAFSFVILTLKDKYGKTIQTTLTDKSGQFGFAVKAGKYTISILKPGYGIYNNLHVGNYHGELIDVVEENNTNLTIVLDSALNTKDDGAASARWHLVLNTSRSILLVVGFLFSALIFLHAITILHAIIFAFYTLALLIPLFSLFTKYLYPLRPASN